MSARHKEVNDTLVNSQMLCKSVAWELSTSITTCNRGERVDRVRGYRPAPGKIAKDHNEVALTMSSIPHPPEAVDRG